MKVGYGLEESEIFRLYLGCLDLSHYPGMGVELSAIKASVVPDHGSIACFDLSSRRTEGHSEPCRMSRAKLSQWKQSQTDQLLSVSRLMHRNYQY